MKHLGRTLLSLLAANALTGCTVLVEQRGAPGNPPRLELSDAVLNQRRVFVAGNITESSAAETIRQLMFLDSRSSDPITVYLMTPGGDLKAAFAMEHAMRLLRSPVNTCAIGECNSAGVVLLAGGTGERMAFVDSTLVIHGIELKNKPPAKYVQSAQDAYTAFWRQNARLPENWLPIPLGKVLALTSKEALEYGIIDKIITPPTPGAKQNRRTEPADGASVANRPPPVPAQ